MIFATVEFLTGPGGSWCCISPWNKLHSSFGIVYKRYQKVGSIHHQARINSDATDKLSFFSRFLSFESVI